MPHALSSGLPKDFLRPCLLLLLREDGEAHGYELLESVCAFGFDRSDPGALYRSLRRLEKDGLVQSGWRDSATGPRKRVYSLTEGGIAELDRRASDLADGERRIDSFLEPLPAGAATAVRQPDATRRDRADGRSPGRRRGPRGRSAR